MSIKDIKHGIIKRTPKFILRGYKLWKIMISQAYTSPELPSEIFQNCRVVSSRDELLSLLPRNGAVAEIGVERGRFTRKIIDINTPKTYVGFDIDFSKLDPGVQSTSSCTVNFCQGESSTLLKRYEDEYFDWIYIDGDHSYDGVKADIAVAMTKVKKGGYLIFNDFAHIVWASYSTFGVHKAATEFLAREKWPMVYWAYERNALYDIVVQRPF